MTRITVPEPLQKGDLLGVVAPAGRITNTDNFERGIAVLRDMGFETVFPRELWAGSGYLAGSDGDRVDELHRFAAEPEVKAIIAARGGYGCLRLLPSLDFSHLKRNHKMFVGFSDISILINLIADRCHCATFHGPTVTTLGSADSDSLERFYHCLAGSWYKALAPAELEVLRGGDSCTGRIFGGNLSTLLTLADTSYDIDWTDRIVFLEDINEPLYKVDRMLTQLALSGRLLSVRGLILGDFGGEHDGDQLLKLRYTEAVWSRVLELLDGTSIPVWGNFPVGHCQRNFTLPVGIEVMMDSGTGTLRFR